MSSSRYQYQAGLAAGYAHSHSVQNSYESAIEEWRIHSNNLKRKLDEANQQNVFMTALHESNNYILQLALDALQRGETNAPLLGKEVRDSLRTRYLSQNLRAKGYALNESDWSIRPL